MLFVDADVEFKPEAVMRMLVPKKDIVCTPYRVKNEPEMMEYAVKFKDSKDIKILPWDIVEIEEGPAGCMLIHRRVFERLMEKRPDLKFHLDTGEWKGEDLSFCALARQEGFKIYANLDSGTTHHGSWGWKGRFGDFLIKKEK